MRKIRQIEISFPTEVELPPGFERALDSLVNMVCEKYEAENPTRTMWPCEFGGKPLGNIFLDDNVDYDMSILCIGVAEREAHDKELEQRGVKTEEVPDAP